MNRVRLDYGELVIGILRDMTEHRVLQAACCTMPAIDRWVIQHLLLDGQGKRLQSEMAQSQPRIAPSTSLAPVSMTINY